MLVQNRMPSAKHQTASVYCRQNDISDPGFMSIEKINANAPQPQRNVLKYFAIFKNVAHSLEPGETPSLNLAKNDEIM